MAWNYATEDIEGKRVVRIKNVEDTHSKKGNPMRVITFALGADEMREYFVEGNSYATRKMMALARGLGRMDDWKRGTFDAENCIGESCGIEMEIDADTLHSSIKKFLTVSEVGGDESGQEAQAPKGGADAGDDLPF